MRLTTTSTETFSLEDVSKKFLNFKVAQHTAPRTLQDYQKEFTKFFKSYDSKAPIEDEVVKYFAAIPDTSPAVYNRPYECLSCFFNYCVEHKYLESNPIKSSGLVKKKDEGNIEAASPAAIKKLLKACNKKEFTGLRNWTIINLMMDTGVRTSELVSLTDEDYNPEERYIVVKKTVAKTRTQRILYVSTSTANALNKLISVKPEGWSNYIFPSRDGNKLDTNQLARQFRTLSAEAGVKITPYQLRHSFATYALENGMDVVALQRTMGHTDIKMTTRYIDNSTKQLKQAHDKYSPINLIESSTRIRGI